MEKTRTTRKATVSLRLLPFLFLLLNLTIISHQGTNAHPNFLKFHCGNHTTNGNGTSTYQTNLNALLLNLSSNTEIDHGFYNFSYGKNSDKVNAIGLCRGDVKAEDCRRCLTDSRVVLPQVCPNASEAIGWYDNCFLRFSNRTIFDVMESWPHFCFCNSEGKLENQKFMDVMIKLMKKLRAKAASGNSLRKYARENMTGPNNQTIYGLAQCTPNLSNNDCNVCLGEAVSQISECCNKKRGGRVLKPSCNVRYEIYNFSGIDDEDTESFLSPQVSPPPSTMSVRGTSHRVRILTAIVVPIVAPAAVLIVFFVIYLKVRRPSRTETEAKVDITTADSFHMDFESLRVATNDFSDANKLGQGGFGPVYQGRLYNGQEIAVKRLSRDSCQGVTEFKNEVLLMAMLQHRNLVRLLGFCIKNGERLLVYEFVPNKSLDYFIFDPVRRGQLNWEMRYKIIEGIARGLLYLHHDSRVRIIHPDLKASNILLDEEMNPKISDFGMARLFVMDQTQDSTTTVVGTFGYMAPEYIKNGIFSIKSDVFSFGVLILEIISSQRNGGFYHEEYVDLVSAAWKHWNEGTLSNIVDPTLSDGDYCSIYEVMRCGLLCAQENVDDRPAMASVVPMLSGYSSTMPVPSEPAFYMGTSFPTTMVSSSGDQSVEGLRYEVSITDQSPR